MKTPFACCPTRLPASRVSRACLRARRSLAILYQQLGQLYRDSQNYQAAVYTYQELGRLGEEEDRRARLLIMDIYRAAKDLPKALQTGKEAVRNIPPILPMRSSEALLLGESGQTDEGVKMLRTQLERQAQRPRNLSEYRPGVRARPPLQRSRRSRQGRGSLARPASRQ